MHCHYDHCNVRMHKAGAQQDAERCPQPQTLYGHLTCISYVLVPHMARAKYCAIARHVVHLHTSHTSHIRTQEAAARKEAEKGLRSAAAAAAAESRAATLLEALEGAEKDSFVIFHVPCSSSCHQLSCMGTSWVWGRLYPAGQLSSTLLIFTHVMSCCYEGAERALRESQANATRLLQEAGGLRDGEGRALDAVQVGLADALFRIMPVRFT